MCGFSLVEVGVQVLWVQLGGCVSLGGCWVGLRWMWVFAGLGGWLGWIEVDVWVFAGGWLGWVEVDVWV